MAVHLTILLLLSGLTGIHSIKTVSKVSVEAGKSISIPCRYEPKYRSHVKYLCEGYYYSSCDYRIKTNQVQKPGRFSISDDINDRVFTVTIKQEKTKDLDLWCVVEIDDSGDVREYFQLSVIRGEPSIQVKDQKLTGFIGGSISIHCNSSESKEMKWCRLDGSCVTGSSGSIDGAAVIINTTVPNVAIVTMSDLQPGSGGWYWCATRNFQMPVNVTVTKTPTTTIRGEVVTTVESKQLSMTRFELKFLIIPLSLLILIVIITLVVWILLKRKHTKAEASATTEDSADGTMALPGPPCILITGDQRFKMAVDQEIVNDHITAPIVAQSYAFSLFYVCNIRYPKKMSLTLEFIQRVFLGIHPARGSKVQTKGPKQEHIPPRMLKLLTDLNNFANPWTV